MMSLLSDQASSPICNFNENQTPALQPIGTQGLATTKKEKHSPLIGGTEATSILLQKARL